jgi:hypothetical protein
MFAQKRGFGWKKGPKEGVPFFGWWRDFRPGRREFGVYECFSPETRKKLELEDLKRQAKFFEEALKDTQKMIEELEKEEKK